MSPNGRSLAWTTVALCACMFTHSYLLISVFPYSGFLAIHLLQIENEDDAAKYAGLIASAFMAGRACTSILWGRAADRYGRIFALCTSLLLSALFSLLFGLTKSFTAAMIIRFLLGMSNGIISTVKTMVSDICSHDVKIEARMMNIVMGMWGWGFLISPVVSGFLAEPFKQFSDKNFIADDSFLSKLLHEYPFLLPNLLGAFQCFLGTILAHFFVHETLPVDQQHSIFNDFRMLQEWCTQYLPRLQHRYTSVPTVKPALADVFQDDDDEEFDSIYNVRVSLDRNSSRSSAISILSQKDTRDCVFLLWGYSFVGLAIDEAFPLFCLSHTAGFGILEKDIGKIMSFTSLIFAVSQYFISHFSYKYCGGLTGSIKVGAALSAPTMFLVPFAHQINRGSEALRWSTFVFISIVLSVHRCFSMVFFSNIAVKLNRTVSTANRGALNGVAGLGASVAKALGPTFAGLLTTMSIKWFQEYASIFIFGILGVLGLFISVGTVLFLPSDVAYENSERADGSDDKADSIELKDRRTRNT
jgi:MFS family permease